MKKIVPYFFWICQLFLLGSCEDDSVEKIEDPEVKSFQFVFTESEVQRWQGDFADYPVGEEENFELEYGYATVPEEAGEEKPAFMISGRNFSDDLFMFLYRKIDGLEPNTTYQLTFNIELASDAPESSVGIGGSPGSSVFLKAGALATEPELVQENVGDVPYWRTKFDKGNQGNSGEDMILLGHVGHDLEEFRYTFIERTNETPFSVTTNEEGELWLIVGTDSGFEGKTTLYYTWLEVQAVPER